MNPIEKLPQFAQELYAEGESLKENLLRVLDNWPLSDNHVRVNLVYVDSNYKQKVEELVDNIRRWFNSLSIQVLPYTVYDKDMLMRILYNLEETVMDYAHSLGSAQNAVNDSMKRGLSIISALPPSLIISQPAYQAKQSSHISNTAFILMWMDPSLPELDDVSNTIKEVCSKFGIRAFRSDDVEQQDTITDLVLNSIASSEFLIADLTGERPNVYYEIGYAHALNKRPILYRRQGTKLHFDLYVHNVPEYKNITDLRERLSRRFEAILGRKPG